MIRTAIAIAAMTAMLPAPATAQGCRSTPGAPDTLPPPRVVSYSVTRESGPPADRAKEGREPSVVGGHPTEGRFLFDIRLDRDVPSHCPIKFDLVDPRDPAPTRAPGVGAEVLRAVSIEELRNVLEVFTDGTNRLVLALRSRPALTGSQRRHDLSFRLGGREGGQPTHPFTLTRLPNGQASLTSSAASVPGGPANQVELTVTLPATIDPAAMVEREMVRFTVVPPSAGAFRPINVDRTREEASDQISVNLSPMRAVMKFVPAPVGQTVTVTLQADLFDTRLSQPITITPDPNSCRPEGSYEVEAGAVIVTIINRGRIACPRFGITVRDWNSQRPYGPGVVEPLLPAPQGAAIPGLRGGLATRGITPPMKSLPTLPGADRIRFEGRYTVPSPYPVAGSQVTVSLMSVDNSLPPITLAPLVFTAADVAAMRGS